MALEVARSGVAGTLPREDGGGKAIKQGKCQMVHRSQYYCREICIQGKSEGSYAADQRQKKEERGRTKT